VIKVPVGRLIQGLWRARGKDWRPFHKLKRSRDNWVPRVFKPVRQWGERHYTGLKTRGATLEIGYEMACSN